jgi:hypothetical protein
MSKATINVREVLADIKAGLSDVQLMEKYHLSRQGCDSLFRQMLEAGHIEQGEIDKRLMTMSTKIVDMAYHCPSCGLPQEHDFEECPQCGVLVSKFNRKQQVKERIKEAVICQEEAKKAKMIERLKKQDENIRLGTLTVNVLKDEHGSIPLDFKKELYPGLMILVRVGNAIALWGTVGAAIFGIIGLVIAVYKGQLWLGIGWLLGSFIGAGLTWIIYKTYSESIQIFLDMSTSLVKSNLLLARIFEKLHTD